MIHDYMCRSVNAIVYDSGASDKFKKHIRGNGNGSEPTFDRSVFLAGMLLSAWTNQKTHVRSIYKVLTQDLPMDWQYKWGVRTQRFDNSGASLGDDMITEADLQNISRRIYDCYSYTPTWLPDPADEPGKFAEERARRRTALYDLVDTMLEATLIERPDESSIYAIDSSGIWASQRYRKFLPTIVHDSRETQEEEILQTITQAQAQDEIKESVRQGKRRKGGASGKPRRSRLGKTDASLGVKTSKSGKHEWYWGYALHAIARVPAPEGPDGKRSEPSLMERFRLSGAKDDVVQESLEIIDAIISQKRKITQLLSDRHYSYKQYDRWFQPLRIRGIEQVVDLHPNQQGFKEWNGILMAAAWAHCPCTPPELGEISRPGPGASTEEWETFHAAIDQRSIYAAERHQPMDATGATRWICPALCGKLGCPLRDGTLEAARELGLPIVNPTSPLSPLCSQRVVTLRPETPEQKSIMRTYQRYYWGSRKHTALYRLRTFIEGFFGVLKNPNASGMKRGNNYYMGIAHSVLVAGCFGVISNIDLIRSWHEETELGNPNSPFLQKENLGGRGVVLVTEAEYSMLEQLRAAEVA